MIDSKNLKLIQEYEKKIKHIENSILKDYKEIKNRHNKLILYLVIIFIILPILSYIVYKLYEGYHDRLLIKKYQNDILIYQALLQEKWDKELNKEMISMTC